MKAKKKALLINMQEMLHTMREANADTQTPDTARVIAVMAEMGDKEIHFFPRAFEGIPTAVWYEDELGNKGTPVITYNSDRPQRYDPTFEEAMRIRQMIASRFDVEFIDAYESEAAGDGTLEPLFSDELMEMQNDIIKARDEFARIVWQYFGTATQEIFTRNDGTYLTDGAAYNYYRYIHHEAVNVLNVLDAYTKQMNIRPRGKETI